MALRKLAVGAAALSAARAAQAAATFLALPLLARLLGPEEFGLVALAMSFVLFTLALSDAGLGHSLVRTPPERKDEWSSAFWMIALLSGALSLLLLVVAWPAALVFDEPRLAPLVIALAPLPLLQGMAAPAIADLLQREKFSQLAFAEVLGAASGVAAAVAVALAGGGAWALVAQQLAFWFAKAGVLACTTRFRPRPVLQLSLLDPHIRFGRDTAGWSLINFLARQVDPLVIAKVIGTAALGLYSMAYRLMSLPAYLVSGPVQNALYARMVAMREDKPALRSLVLISSRALAVFVFPPMAVLCVASGAFIEVFLSERWLPAAVLFTVLAPIGALQAITGLNGPLLMATGRTDLRLRLTWEFTALWVIAVPFLALWGLTAVTIGFAVIYLLYLPRLLHLFLKPVEGKIADYLRAISIPLLAAVGLAATHLTMKAILPGAPPWAEISFAVSEVLIGYGVTAWALRGRLLDDLRTVQTLFSRRPLHATAGPRASPAPLLQK